MPEGWNDTYVVLIPKVKDPSRIKDLRPISLCNVLYKIVSKVLANRLKTILPEVILDNQSAFVPGRLITDNVVIAYEMSHYLMNKRSGKEGFAAVKVDMSKAYDRVEWRFLRAMMLKLGFSLRWVDLVMKCVTTVTYQIKVNGKATAKFAPSWGLRQGNPLSPYLFTIGAEGLSALIHDAQCRQVFSGIKICTNAPSITHLFFADDSLLLMRAKVEEAKILREILALYEDCSGQCINTDKSAIMFSNNTKITAKECVKHELNIRSEAWNEKYLGLPVYVGRSKKKAFAYIKDKVWKYIYGWEVKPVSKCGKEILIKAVAQAIPTFAMLCFYLTKSLCDELSAMIARYWWSQQEKGNKIHWLSWEKLIKPKGEGGLGFRDIHAFNIAMLSRQVWRLMENPDSLCAKLLKAKYYPNTDVLQALPQENMSYTWRSILHGVELVKEGIIWRIGNGESVNIWTDPWIPRAWSRRIVTPRRNVLMTKVSELICHVTGQWDNQLLEDTFWPEDVEAIQSIPLREGMTDFMTWHFDPKGVHSVKQAYKLQRELEHMHGNGGQGCSTRTPTMLQDKGDRSWLRLWDIPCPGKIKHFIWRCKHNSLPLRNNLSRKGVYIENPSCVMCNRNYEDGGHLFVHCKEVKLVWRALNLEHVRLKLETCNSIDETLDEIWNQQLKVRMEVLVMWWLWWHQRNRAREGEKPLEASDVAHRARCMATEYLQVFGKMDKSVPKNSERWSPPADGIIKFNSDGAWMPGRYDGAWGEVIAAKARKIQNANDAFAAELRAMEEAINLASDLGVILAVFETDSQILAQALNRRGPDYSLQGQVIDGLKAQLTLWFSGAEVRACGRTANAAAHEIAKLGNACSLNDVLLWEYVCPAEIAEIVSDDIANLSV
jgi:hypothetical protein